MKQAPSPSIISAAVFPHPMEVRSCAATHSPPSLCQCATHCAPTHHLASVHPLPHTPQVEAERVAWRLSEQLGLPLTTVLPNFVMGPVAAKEAAAGISVGFFKVRLGEGTRVAIAHVEGAQKDEKRCLGRWQPGRKYG